MTQGATPADVANRPADAADVEGRRDAADGRAPAGAFDEARVHLQVLGEELDLHIRVRVGPATVADLLAPARALSAAAARVAEEQATAAGDVVQCRAGCGACCRQLVPISTVEAARLAAHVAALPDASRAAVEARFAAAVAAMEDAGVLAADAPGGRWALQSAARDGAAAWLDVSRRYFQARIPCPFLVDEACSVYEERPMVCREYLVVSDPQRCAELDGGALTLERPLRASEALGRAAAEVLGLPTSTLPLTLLLEWVAAHGTALDVQCDGEALFWALMREVDADGTEPFEARG